jgi:ABC-type polysaccharide/polyol phosphate export permease
MAIPEEPTLGRSLAIQRNVLHALFMREVLTRYGRHNIGFLWLFVEPMIFTLGVTALWTIAGLSKLSSLPIAAFALTGYSTVLLWRNMPSRCIGGLAPNATLMYHRNVRVIDIYLSRIALEFFGATMSFVLLGAVMIAAEIIAPPENILLVTGAWLLTAWFGAALAMLLGAWSESAEIIEKLWHPAAYILFPLAGAAFLVDALPRDFQAAVLWLPMVHCTEMLRDGYFGSQFNAIYDAGYLAVCNLALSALALAFERKVSREFVPE